MYLPFLTEGTTTVATGMENLTSAISTLMEMAGTMLTTVLDNPVLAICFGAGFVGIIAGVVHTVKNL